MKKVILLTLLLVGVVVSFYSCSKGTNDNILSLQDKELEGFFSSKEYLNLKENFGISVEDYSLEHFLKETHPEAKVNIFYVPIVREGERIGNIAIYFSTEKNIYRTLYERYNLTDENGMIEIFTSKKQFVADFTAKKLLEENSYELKINSVVDDKSIQTMRLSTKANSEEEFPKPEDGWWECTSRCYKIAMESCMHSDDTCVYYCLILDLQPISYCTLAISGACSIYCL